MSRRPVTMPPSVLPLARETGRTLRWRLHQGFKTAILNGQFGAGARLPSTRTLADSLGISRSTVVEAFDQLAAEGFIDRRPGSGTFVSRRLDTLPSSGRAVRPPDGNPGRRPSHRVQNVQNKRQDAEETRDPQAVNQPPPPFAPCEPDAGLFPHRLWARMLARHARAPASPAVAPDPAGLPRLRQALAAHLAISRGVAASPERIVVVPGARQALYLCAVALLDAGDSVWCEDPGYLDARRAFALAGVHPVPIPVDGDGLDVDAAEHLAPRARAAYVTPSHQFPTDAVMGLGRRLRLLDWAARNDTWILEDDYDSEFCYDNRPLPALQGLDHHQAVIYVGTLNKVTFPGLRLGYLVAPSIVADAFVALAAALSPSPPIAVQAAAADFIAEGHLAQHITRMRAVYRERQHLLVTELDRHAGDDISLAPVPVGMDILATVRRASARKVAERAATYGLDVCPLSRFSARPVPEAIVLGYTHLQPERIRAAARDLAQALAAARR